MAYIGPLPAETFTSFATQEFSTSATTSYTLDHAVTNENEIALFVNNVRQQPGSGKAYTATGTALTLSAATASTDTMYAVFLGRALQTVNPAGGSVGSSQIAAEMITGQTALSSTPADTDELLISDAGTLKRIDYSLLKSTPGLVLITTTTVSSGVSEVAFTSGIDSTYDTYKLFISGMHGATDDKHVQFHYSNDGGSSYLSNNYVFAGYSSNAGGTHGNQASGSAGSIELTLERAGASNDESFNAVINMYQFHKTEFHKCMDYHCSYIDDDANCTSLVGAASNTGNESAVNAIRIKYEAGNIDKGTFQLFGVSKT